MAHLIAIRFGIEHSKMIDAVATNINSIAELCVKHEVLRLELFGSAATGRFRPESSDLDFIVDLGDYDARVGDRFLDLAEDLEHLLGRHIDLVTERSLTNPYLRQSIQASRELVYAVEHSRAVA